MNAIPRIVVVGSINQDEVYVVSSLPQPGETVLSRDRRMQLGGKGANQAVAASRLGAQVVMVASVGADLPGESAIERLAREGVNSAGVRRYAASFTGGAVVVVEKIW